MGHIEEVPLEEIDISCENITIFHPMQSSRNPAPPQNLMARRNHQAENP